MRVTEKNGQPIDLRPATDGFEVRNEDVARLSPFVRNHVNMLGRSSFPASRPAGLPVYGGASGRRDLGQYGVEQAGDSVVEVCAAQGDGPT